jgi:hypothetical protein
MPTTLEKGYCPWGYYMPNNQGEVSAHQRAMLQMPCPSYDGFAIHSQWTLQVLHKHDSWNEFGDGIPIEIPITVTQSNLQGDQLHQFVAPLQQAVYTMPTEAEQQQFNLGQPEKPAKGQDHDAVGQQVQE